MGEKQEKHSWRSVLESAMGIIFLLLALWLLARSLQDYKLEDVTQSLRRIPAYALALASGLVALNLWVMAQFDVLALRSMQLPVRYGQAVWVGFLSCVAGRTIGFPLLTGSALRYRFYHRWGLTPAQISRVIVFQLASLWLGFMALAGVALLMEPVPLPLSWAKGSVSMRYLGSVLVAGVGAYIALSLFRKRPLRFFRLDVPVASFPTALVQTGFSILKWGLDAAICMSSSSPDILFRSFYFSVYFLRHKSCRCRVTRRVG